MKTVPNPQGEVKVAQSCPTLQPHVLYRPWSMEFSGPECLRGQPFPSPRNLPNPGIEPRCPTLQADSLPAEPQGKPSNTGVGSLSLLHGIFPTQRSNPGLPHCRRILYQLSNQGSNARDLGLIPRSGRSPDQGMATHSSGNGEWSLVKSLRLLIFWGLPWCLSGKESACNVGDLGLLSFPWVRKIPWRRTQQPTPVVLVGESRGQRSLAGYSPHGHKELDTTERAYSH